MGIQLWSQSALRLHENNSKMKLFVILGVILGACVIQILGQDWGLAGAFGDQKEEASKDDSTPSLDNPGTRAEEKREVADAEPARFMSLSLMKSFASKEQLRLIL